MAHWREAFEKCKVRGYIARKNGYIADIPDDYKYWKNQSTPMECLIAWQDQIQYDWEHFDPEGEETSIVG